MEKKSKIKKESRKNIIFYLIMIFMLTVSVYVFSKTRDDSISVGGFGNKEKTFENVSLTEAFEKIFGKDVFLEKGRL